MQAFAMRGLGNDLGQVKSSNVLILKYVRQCFGDYTPLLVNCSPYNGIGTSVDIPYRVSSDAWVAMAAVVSTPCDLSQIVCVRACVCVPVCVCLRARACSPVRRKMLISFGAVSLS